VTLLVAVSRHAIDSACTILILDDSISFLIHSALKSY